jgi:SNF-related kinase
LSELLILSSLFLTLFKMFFFTSFLLQVRLYEVIDTQTRLYLVLEFADGGDMYDYIMRHEGGLEEDAAREYFKQIVAAIQYCHRLHVVHR